MKRELRIPADGLQLGRITLSHETSRYVVKVHRKKTGDMLQLFDPVAGLQASGTISSDRLPSVEIEIGEPPLSAPTANLLITVIQSLGKGDKPEQAVRDATVFGAQRVIFVHSERTVARGELKKDRLLRVAAQVARQCERGDLPEVLGALSLEDALRLPEISKQSRVICTWGEEAVPLLQAVSREEARDVGVTVLIGPEGGFSEDETAQARAAGFRLVSLGPYVLRTEVACGAVLAALRFRDEAK